MRPGLTALAPNFEGALPYRLSRKSAFLGLGLSLPLQRYALDRAKRCSSVPAPANQPLLGVAIVRETNPVQAENIIAIRNTFAKNRSTRARRVVCGSEIRGVHDRLPFHLSQHDRDLVGFVGLDLEEGRSLVASLQRGLRLDLGATPFVKRDVSVHVVSLVNSATVLRLRIALAELAVTSCRPWPEAPPRCCKWFPSAQRSLAGQMKQYAARRSCNSRAGNAVDR